MSYIEQLPKPFIVLAPMDDVTDTVFRRLIADIAPADLYMTEFTNVDGLQSPGRKALLKKLRYEPSEQPLIAQIWGKNPDNYYKTAQELVEMGFAGVDINMGCPDKAVLRNGCGGALSETPELAAEIIKAVQAGVEGKIPVSVKTRLGRRQYMPEWIETILSQKLAMLTIHLRTVKELSKVPAHWELMPEIKTLRDSISPQTLLVGNGDIIDRPHAEKLCKEYQNDGTMIGRGIFADPFAMSAQSPWATMLPKEKIELYIKHVELFEQTWREGERPVVTLNKFCKIYINDFPNAKEARAKLMSCKTLEELKDKLHSLKSMQ